MLYIPNRSREIDREYTPEQKVQANMMFWAYMFAVSIVTTLIFGFLWSPHPIFLPIVFCFYIITVNLQRRILYVLREYAKRGFNGLKNNGINPIYCLSISYSRTIIFIAFAWINWHTSFAMNFLYLIGVNYRQIWRNGGVDSIEHLTARGIISVIAGFLGLIISEPAITEIDIDYQRAIKHKYYRPSRKKFGYTKFFVWPKRNNESITHYLKRYALDRSKILLFGLLIGAAIATPLSLLIPTMYHVGTYITMVWICGIPIFLMFHRTGLVEALPIDPDEALKGPLVDQILNPISPKPSRPGQIKMDNIVSEASQQMNTLAKAVAPQLTRLGQSVLNQKTLDVLSNVIKPIGSDNTLVWEPSAYYFGYRKHERKNLLWGTAFEGVPGSGKTIQINLWLKDSYISAYESHKATLLVIDTKGNMPQVLTGMGIRNIAILDSFDLRSKCYMFSEDYITDDHVNYLVEVLVPISKKNDEYWTQCAQDLLREIVRVLRYIKGNYTLRDLVLATQSRNDMVALLERCEDTAWAAETYLEASSREPSKAVSSIISTLRTHFAKYGVIAALQYQAFREGQTFSINAFLQDGGAAIIKVLDQSSASANVIGRLFARRTVDVVLSQPDQKDDAEFAKHFFVFDELPSLGHQGDTITKLLHRGRSKGCATLLAWQTYQSLEKIYGHDGAEEILNECQNIGIMRTNSPRAAQHASDLFGSVETKEYPPNISMQIEPEPTLSVSRSEQTHNRRNVLPSQFMGLPLPNKNTGTGIHGFYKSEQHGVWREEIPSDYISRNLPRPDRSVPEFMERPPEHQKLPQWTAEERAELGLDD